MDTTQPRFGVLSSSVNPQELSTTVQALMKVVGGILVFYGVITAADSTTLLSHVNQLVTTVIALVPLAYSAWHSGEVIFGILRKGVVALVQHRSV